MVGEKEGAVGERKEGRSAIRVPGELSFEGKGKEEEEMQKKS